jgi:glutamate--cysteine ligase
VSIERRLLPLVQRHARSERWSAVPSAKGAPRFDVPGGGSFTFEPGGQIEYASPPFASPSDLLTNLRNVLVPLQAAALDAGIELLGVGIDPLNTADETPLQIEADRYRAMDTYFAGIGDAGARMMRQTASIQVNVDPTPGSTDATWRMLNAAAPLLTAIFANSRTYRGEDTGFASYRSRTWQLLDPTRTGLAWNGPDATSAYTSFALDAVAIFVRSECGEYLPFREWVANGLATPQSTAVHLSTLFPEVRSRGWFEVRSIDALRPECYAAPVLMIAGLALDAAATHHAIDLLGEPDERLLPRVAGEGLRDPQIAAMAGDLARIALEACGRLGDRCAGADIEAAEEFFNRYTFRGLCPADHAPAPEAIATAA